MQFDFIPFAGVGTKKQRVDLVPNDHENALVRPTLETEDAIFPLFSSSSAAKSHNRRATIARTRSPSRVINKVIF